MSKRITDRPLRPGYRSDLETEAGCWAAMQRALRQQTRYRFTAADRAKGKATQRQQGRFGRGRFTPVYALAAPSTGAEE